MERRKIMKLDKFITGLLLSVKLLLVLYIATRLTDWFIAPMKIMPFGMADIGILMATGTFTYSLFLWYELVSADKYSQYDLCRSDIKKVIKARRAVSPVNKALREKIQISEAMTIEVISITILIYLIPVIYLVFLAK
ncbi:hypothetical protein CR969_03290 [Candidatus Saccharibacteria bacterium]|nr:MAG: hypothetical protein CR969_03290 [Candidatus Saccharibacteria bacterium]